MPSVSPEPAPRTMRGTDLTPDACNENAPDARDDPRTMREKTSRSLRDSSDAPCFLPSECTACDKGASDALYLN